MIDVLLPGERDTLREPVTDLVGELRRLEVLSDDASLADVDGVDFIVEDESVEVAETNVEDIVNLRINAAVRGSIDGEALPIGDWIRENVDEDLSTLDTESDEADEGTLPLTAVREDGRWYLSLFYTAAEVDPRRGRPGDPGRGRRAGRRRQSRGGARLPARRHRAARRGGRAGDPQPRRVPGAAALRPAVHRRRPGSARCHRGPVDRLPQPDLRGVRQRRHPLGDGFPPHRRDHRRGRVSDDRPEQRLLERGVGGREGRLVRRCRQRGVARRAVR